MMNTDIIVKSKQHSGNRGPKTGPKILELFINYFVFAGFVWEVCVSVCEPRFSHMV